MPRCLRLHVKQIEVQGYEEKEDELKLVKYLLKNSKVLKRMIIRCKESASTKDLCQKLLMFDLSSSILLRVFSQDL